MNDIDEWNDIEDLERLREEETDPKERDLLKKEIDKKIKIFFDKYCVGEDDE